MNGHHVRRLLILAGIGAAVLMAAVPARAHIQVQPAEVAPADPVLFTVLVPGEAAAGTSKVELKVPAGVYPFSYEETPGWRRKLVTKPNGLVDRIVWSGSAAPDGLVKFAFLAGTPERTGPVRWAAIQTYANGQRSRWIGEPNADNPAPVTVVSETAARQNAGGEGREEGRTNAAVDSSTTVSSTDETDWPLTITALLGFFFGMSSLAILLMNKRNEGRN